MTRNRFMTASVLALTLLGAACSGDGGGEAAEGTPTSPAVTLEDTSITVDPTDVQAGEVTFTATNNGTETHEFEVFEGDATALPVDSGVADVSSVTLLDEVEDIVPGTEADLAMSLDPGTYSLICNLPGHYERGMYAAITVA